MAQEDLNAAEAGLLSAIKAGDSRAIELFKGELTRLQSGAAPAGANPAAKPAARAPEARTPGEALLDGARRTTGIALAAPGRALAGGLDLLGLGMNKAGDALGVSQENLPQPGWFSRRMSGVADEIAGRPIGESTGRAALEAAITAPLSGAKTAVGAAKVLGAAGAAGGVTHAAIENGMSPWAALPLGLAVGHGTGAALNKVPGINGLTPAETLAKAPLKAATEGTTQQAFREGTNSQMLAHGHDVPLLPSQALSTSSPELEALQAALLASRSSGGTKMRELVSTQANRVKQLGEGLRNVGGQTPRGDDLLAEGVQKLAQREMKGRSEAINDATRGLYQDPLGSSWKFGPQLEQNVEAGLARAAEKYRSEPTVVQAIEHARTQLTQLLSNPAVTPVEVSNMVGHLKRNVLPDMSKTGTSDLNRARGIVTELLTPLEGVVTKHAPAIGKGQALQSELRQDLPGKFDEVTRTAAAGGGPSGMLNAASQRPELVGAIAKQDPQLAQELLQRSVNNAIDKAFKPDVRTGVQSANAGLSAKDAMVRSLEGQALQKNLELLFQGHPDPKAASEGFNRVLDVMANASKPTGGRGVGAQAPNAVGEVTRGGLGSMPQRINVLGRMGQTVYGQFRDNAAVRVLMQPDVMDRLAYIARMPKVKLTPALVAATVPQLFQESSNVP